MVAQVRDQRSLAVERCRLGLRDGLGIQDGDLCLPSRIEAQSAGARNPHYRQVGRFGCLRLQTSRGLITPLLWRCSLRRALPGRCDAGKSCWFTHWKLPKSWVYRSNMPTRTGMVTITAKVSIQVAALRSWAAARSDMRRNSMMARNSASTAAPAGAQTVASWDHATVLTAMRAAV